MRSKTLDFDGHNCRECHSPIIDYLGVLGLCPACGAMINAKELGLSEDDPMENICLFKMATSKKIFNNAIPRQYLDTFETGFIIETSSGERIHITPVDGGYKFRDIDPPEYINDLEGYATVVIEDCDVERLAQSKESVQMSNRFSYYGIKKDAFMKFKMISDEEGLLTRGKVKKLYTPVNNMPPYRININHFKMPGKKYCLEDYYDDDFAIQSNGNMYEFRYSKNQLYFEGELVLSILSVHNHVKLDLFNPELIIEASSHELFRGKPFMILTQKDDKQIGLKVINEVVLEISNI